MSAIVKRLERSRAGGATAAGLLAEAALLLGDARLLAADLEGGDILIQEASEEFARLEATCRGAFSRYPAVRGAGFHSGDSDPRAFAIYSTLSEVQKAGMYTPGDLAGMLATGTVSPAWAAAESLRLRVFLVVLRALMDTVDRRDLSLQEYREAIAGAARDLGRVALAHPR